LAGSVILPFPAQTWHLTGYILLVAGTGCFTFGKPVPSQAAQVCSAIFGAILNVHSCLGENQSKKPASLIWRVSRSG
jgi:hypothetical protein